MILVKETTKWDCGAVNHTYLMSDNKSKMYGYFKWNNPKEFTMFKNSIRIDTRYRTFKVLQKGLKKNEH